ncbi:MAG: DMT family transporter [Alphaproteobacteria bacterium]|nr:DMT family transporter [Alphaproteobacteria bacterium]MBU1559941.1 DMT family transporter [Alphaproteobacteria bacterium]MBU2302243.1 DMT family transporter [Alphaproteobacteria bacterium]MBU2369886.1 DMT family transporter [Alphaproteobacteria bacterium]
MSRPLAALMLLVCTMLWGFAFVAQKSAMDSMGPLTFAGVRYLLGGLLVLPLALWERRRRPTPLSSTHWALIIAMSLVFFIGSWLQQTGLATTTATNAGFLTGLYVFFVPLLGFLIFRSRPHPIIFAGVPLALVGIYYLNGGGLDSFNGGDGLIVISAVFWAMHVILLGHIARATGLPIFVSAISFLFAGAVALGLAFVIETPTLQGIGAGWLEIAYAGILSTAVAFTFQAIGQQYVPPANAAIILSAESLFAAIGGALLLGDRLPPIGYAGAALIFAAIVAVEAIPPLWSRRQAHMAKTTN